MAQIVGHEVDHINTGKNNPHHGRPLLIVTKDEMHLGTVADLAEVLERDYYAYGGRELVEVRAREIGGGTVEASYTTRGERVGCEARWQQREVVVTFPDGATASGFYRVNCDA